jgi:hypothetical protein
MMDCLRVKARIVLCAISLVSFSLLARAAEWPAITPEQRALKDVQEQPGAPAIILERQEVADDLNNFHSTFKRIKIFTEEGRKYADVELPYNRQGFSVGDISGRTVHPDGTVIPFGGKPFDKVILRGKGMRYHVKAFTLPDVQVGSIIDFRYTLRYGDRSLLAPEWIIQDELFQKKANFKFIPFQGGGSVYVQLSHGQIANQVSWTTFLPPQYKPQEHTLPKSQFARKQVSYWVDLDTADVPAFIEEPFMPPPEVLKWRIEFYYVVSAKQQDYWKDQGKFWNKDVESFVGNKKGVAEAVAQLVVPNDTPVEKVRKIYSFVTQLENTSYVPFRPEQEKKVLGIELNQGVDDVLRQRSGNHDDLNRLFVAMVRAAGMPSWLMLVPNREDKIFVPELFDMHQFSSEIAIVKLDSKDVFLDPGTKFCPYGTTDWRYSGVKGLRQAEAKGTEISETPMSNYNQAMVTRFARLKINDEGRAEGSLGVAYYGLEAMARRQEGGKMEAEGRKKFLEDEVKSWLPADSEVSVSKPPDWDKTDDTMVAQFSIKTPMMISAGRRMLVPLHPFEFNAHARFASAQRINSVYFYYPYREIDELHITLPPSMQIENLPADETQKLEYAIYKSEQKPEGNNGIHAKRDLVMGGMVFTTNLYQEVKGFYDKVKAGDDQEAILKAASHAQAN